MINYMDMKIELLPLPSRDLQESKNFYLNIMGFHLDHDVHPGNGMHIIQFTPPGSACSIAIGTGMGMEAASPVSGIHLVVSDINLAHKTLTQKGLFIDEINDMGGVKFASFIDPSGNSWQLQQAYSGSL